MSTRNTDGIKALTEHGEYFIFLVGCLASLSIIYVVLNEEVQLIISRSVLQAFATAAQQLDAQESDWISSTIIFCLEKIKPRVVSFEESDAGLRKHLAEIHICHAEYIDAGRVLAAINMESGNW